MKLSFILAICVLGVIAQVSARRRKHKHEDATTETAAAVHVTAGKEEKIRCEFYKQDCSNLKCESSKTNTCVYNPAENKYPFCACVAKECLTEDELDVKDDDGCDKHCKIQNKLNIGKCTTEFESYASEPQKCTCKRGCVQFASNNTCNELPCDQGWEGACVSAAREGRSEFCACEPKGCYLNWGKPDVKDVKDAAGCRAHCQKLNKNWGGSCSKGNPSRMYEYGTPRECGCFGRDYPN